MDGAAAPKLNRPLPVQRSSTNYAMMDEAALNANRPLPVHRLGGKVAMITGGARSSGLETARRLLREGANVSLMDSKAQTLDAAVTVLKGVLATGQPVQARILTTVADPTLSAEVEACVRKTVEQFGRLDVAFLNSGVSEEPTSILESTEEEYDRIMDINVKSAFLGLKHAATAMQQAGNGGSIILTSSIASLQGSPGQALYSGSKFALRGLALSAAEELGQHGIRVNTIHPSDIEAPVGAATPLGRGARVDDVASVVAFLSSEDSKFMTGGLLKIDGGCVSL